MSAPSPAALLDDPAVGEEQDPVGHRRSAGVVSDHHDRLTVVTDGAEQLEDLAARPRVEVAGRLVGEDDLRPGDERARDRDALLLSARQLRRTMVEPVFEPDRLDQLIEPACRACRRRS